LKVPFYIARRYLSSKKKKNTIHWITRVSVIGITVTTAALVILLSAFNGIEKMVEKLYSEFDADITIRSTQNKTFFQNEIDTALLLKIPGVNYVVNTVEEVVVLKHEKKWVNAKVLGVSPDFLKQTSMGQHMVDGYAALSEGGQSVGIIGASLLDKLEGFIPSSGYETIQIYAPKRDVKMTLGSNPFSTDRVLLSGRMNFNREVNAEYLVIDLQKAREILDYRDEVSAIFIDAKPGVKNEELKEAIQLAIGKDFVVKTNYEKNELIFKTSQSEKVIVIIILLFIFVIAAFTLVAALTMLYIEKKENLATLSAMGADQNFIFRLFFIEGLLIAFKGIFLGLLIGYAIALSQVYGSFLTMPNSGGEPFPMEVNTSDGFMIFGLVSVLAFLASYLPAKVLVKSGGK
jgi:lipoprotein-releasing system permease protein